MVLQQAREGQDASLLVGDVPECTPRICRGENMEERVEHGGPVSAVEFGCRAGGGPDDFRANKTIRPPFSSIFVSNQAQPRLCRCPKLSTPRCLRMSEKAYRRGAGPKTKGTYIELSGNEQTPESKERRMNNADGELELGGGYSKRVQGYDVLGSLMGAFPETAILRRFGALSAQDLLLRQAELACLEEDLNIYQQGDKDSKHPDRERYALSWDKLQDSAEEADGNDGSQLKTILKIREKLKEYRVYHIHLILPSGSLHRS